MAFTKVTNAGIGSTNTVLLHNLNVVGTVTATDGIFSGIGSFGGNVSVGGVLTYEDVTNVDSVGLITARKGISVLGAGVTIAGGGLNVNAGVSTFGGNVTVGSGITLSPDGDGYYTGIVTATTFKGALTGSVTGAATRITVTDQSTDTTCNVLFAQGETGNLLPHSGTNLTFNSSSGALTATSFSGDGSSLTGLQAGKFLTDGIGITTVTPVGIETSTIARKDLAGPAGNTATGAGSSFHGAYLGDGFLSFNTEFSNSSGYYISTFTNSLVAGPIQLGSTLTLDGNLVIV